MSEYVITSAFELGISDLLPFQVRIGGGNAMEQQTAPLAAKFFLCGSAEILRKCVGLRERPPGLHERYPRACRNPPGFGMFVCLHPEIAKIELRKRYCKFSMHNDRQVVAAQNDSASLYPLSIV